jgi:hypothetical protein
MTLLNFDVGFTPESGHQLSALGCPLWATSRHPAGFLSDYKIVEVHQWIKFAPAIELTEVRTPVLPENQS